MKLSDFGKFIRKYRIDQDIRLKDMADALGFSSAFLSYIENDVKPIPLGLEDKIAKVYSFTDKLRTELNKAVDRSRKKIVLQVPDNETDQVFLGDFCRHFNTLTAEQKTEIRRLLNGM